MLLRARSLPAREYHRSPAKVSPDTRAPSARGTSDPKTWQKAKDTSFLLSAEKEGGYRPRLASLAPDVYFR